MWDKKNQLMAHLIHRFTGVRSAGFYELIDRASLALPGHAILDVMLDSVSSYGSNEKYTALFTGNPDFSTNPIEWQLYIYCIVP